MAEDASPMSAVARTERRLNEILFGQRELVRLFLTGVLAGGHILLEGLPGVGKTQLVRSFARLSGLVCNRIQFTPDLMPLDITGSDLLVEEADGRRFVFSPGPVFANLVIADEINRASPKTQSALLEAMQEGQVTVLGRTHPLPVPFSVLATQNPIELEGTYPLPEAQLDRFLFKLGVGQVGAEELRDIALGKAGGSADHPPEMTPAEVAAAMAAVRAIPLSRPIADYIARLVIATRPESGGMAGGIRYGASPRAVLALAAASRARAFLDGRLTVGFDDVKAVAVPALAHRIILDYQARLDGLDNETVIAGLVAATPELDREAPRSLAAKIAGG
ncbi:MAG: AAA family ATPase [Planctomycetes bacterium]|nr:AAA family ATPase [Planctomycetota bacterium]